MMKVCEIVAEARLKEEGRLRDDRLQLSGVLFLPPRHLDG